MRIQLVTTAPVVVTVDLETETVVRVFVDDEDLQPWSNAVKDDDVFDEIDMRSNDARDAVRIAEDSTWPQWDVG